MSSDALYSLLAILAILAIIVVLVDATMLTKKRKTHAHFSQCCQ